MGHAGVDEAMREREDAALAVRGADGFRAHPLRVAYAATLCDEPDAPSRTTIR